MMAKSATGGGRRFWFDPRFAIGVVLIAVAVAGTVFVVSAADSSTEVMVARTALVPGQKITTADLTVSKVSIGDPALYLTPPDVGESGLIVSRAISEGEIVPVSAVGSIAGAQFTTVVVDLAGRLAESIEPGGTADLWSTSKTEDGDYGAPSVIVGAATVVRIIEPDGLVVDDTSGSVELLIPRDATARVLESIANDDVLSLVPATLPAGG
jgi:hypothetical protein